MDVETSLNHTRAIDTNNRLYCFGATTKDFLGTSSDANSPQEVDASLRFIDVAGGYDHTCAIRTDGQAMCFGVTNNPACGTGASPNDCDIPTLVQGGHQFTEIDAGTQTNCAIEQGTNLLYCWGLYFHENPSDATDANLQSTSAIKIHAGTSYDKVFAGRNHLCARNMDDHALYCIGDNPFAELGTGTGVYHSTPTRMLGDHQFIKYDFGIGHGCGVSTDQELLCSGNYSNGQTGQARSGDQILITPNILLPSLKKVTVGGFSTCAIDSNDNALCTGPNDRGRIGTGSQHWRPTFFPIVSPLNFKELTSGDSFHCGLSSDGFICLHLWCVDR